MRELRIKNAELRMAVHSIFCILYSAFFILNSAFSQNPLVKQWDYDYGGNKSEWLYAFQPTIDGGFILGGFSTSGISGDKTQPNWDTTLFSSDYWIIKLDALGKKQWDKRFGGIG